MFKKLIKYLTYNKRKKRIENKIFQRILKKNPNAEFYNSETGNLLVEGELLFKTIERFNPRNGEIIGEKNYCLYRMVRFPYISQGHHCVIRFLFDKFGNLHYCDSRGYGFEKKFCSNYLEEDIGNFLWL